jgi:hypothetical protein
MDRSLPLLSALAALLSLNLLSSDLESSTPAQVLASDGFYPDAVELSWTPVGGAELYQVFRSVYPNPSSEELEAVALLPGAGPLQVLDRLLESNQYYYYWVAAYVPGMGWGSLRELDAGYAWDGGLEPGIRFEDEPNDNLAMATVLDASDFVIGEDWAIEGGEVRRYVSVKAEGDQTLDYYTFEVTTSGSYVLDIDFTREPGRRAFDSEIALWDQYGNVLAANDDSGGDAGSFTGVDSRLAIYLNPGVYRVGVSSYPSNPTFGQWSSSSKPIPARASYTLQISSEAVLDLDGDGLDDAWELGYAEALGSAGDLSILDGINGNYDGDAYSDMQEYLWASDPTQVSNAVNFPDANLDRAIRDQLGLDPEPRPVFEEDLVGMTSLEANYYEIEDLSGA